MESTKRGQHVKTRWRIFLEKTKAFNLSFYPCSIKEWCALSEEIRNILSVNKFKEIILSFIRHKENSVFAIHDTKGIKLLTRLRLNFSHLNEHKFRHGLRDTVDPVCKWGLRAETTLHFLLRCSLYSTVRTELLDDIYTVAASCMSYPDKKLLNILLYGSEYFSVKWIFRKVLNTLTTHCFYKMKNKNFKLSLLC